MSGYLNSAVWSFNYHEMAVKGGDKYHLVSHYWNIAGIKLFL